MASKIYYSPFIPAFSPNGLPVPGARLYFFYSGTNSPAPIWTDSSMTISAANPVISDLAARFPDIYLDESIDYRVRITDSKGAPLGADTDPYVPGQALKGDKGDPGPAGQTFLTLATFKAAPITNEKQALKDPVYPFSDYFWSIGDYSGTSAADLAALNIIKADSTPLSEGAWVRQKDTGIAASVAGTLSDALSGRINARQLGVNSAATPAENLARIQAAINATEEGGVCIINGTGTIVVDTSVGLSNCIQIPRPMTVQIDARLKASSGAVQANPQVMFRIPAGSDGVSFTGNGLLEGDGTINDANSGDISTHPGLVYCEADDFTFDGPRIRTPAKYAIALVNCTGARIRGVFRGGPVTYTVGNTGYFAIIATGGGNHDIAIKMGRTIDGGRFINGIFSSGLYGNANSLYVHDCEADCHEKLLYGYGDDHIVTNSRVINGDQTDVIRIIGNRGRVDNCVIRDCKGGVSIYDGTDGEIINCTMTGMKQIAINVGQLSGAYSGGFHRTKITGNTCVADAVSGIRADGIRFNASGSDADDIEISGNFVQGFAPTNGQALIRVDTAANTIRRAIINGNTLVDTVQNALIIRGLRDSIVEGQQYSNITGNWGVASTHLGVSNNTWRNNVAIGGVGFIGIAGLASDDKTTGNRYTSAALVQNVTMTAGQGAVATPMTITHGGVASNARIRFDPVNAAFSVMAVAKGDPIGTPSSGNITVVSGNNTNFAGTEQGRVTIDQ